MQNDNYAADRIAIKDLSYRYATAVDRREFALLHEVFTPDGMIDAPQNGYKFEGIEAICAAMEHIKQYSRTLHSMFNQLVTFNADGNTASSETYCLANHIYDKDGVTRKLDWGIRYRDELVRVNGAWRIKRRVLNLDWEQDLPLTL